MLTDIVSKVNAHWNLSLCKCTDDWKADGYRWCHNGTKKLPVWLCFNDIVPTEKEKNTIESGKCLVDLHMHFAQRLLKQLFPKLSGMRLTLLQAQSHRQETSMLYRYCTSNPIIGLLCGPSRKGNKFSLFYAKHSPRAISKADWCCRLLKS